MNALILAIVGFVLAASPVLAEETCVEVEIGGEKTPRLSCLNQQLQKKVENVRPVPNVAPLDAGSSALSLGVLNETALKQQYGPNYGKSVVPYRPANSYGRPSR